MLVTGAPRLCSCVGLARVLPFLGTHQIRDVCTKRDDTLAAAVDNEGHCVRSYLLVLDQSLQLTAIRRVCVEQNDDVMKWKHY